jgi:PAP2 superfamily
MKKRARAVLCLSFGVAVVVPSLAADQPGSAAPGQPAPGHDAVTVWNANAVEAALAAGITPAFDPLHESRLYAMMHIAIHDALNAIERRSRPYALDVRVAPGTSADAAVAAAARGVLVSELQNLPDIFTPDQITAAVNGVEADYAAALAAIPAGRPKDRGIAIGQAAAAVILAVREGDGADTEFLDFDYPQGDEPGEFRFVEGSPFAVAPEWGEVTPFVLRDGSQFRAPPPHNLAGKKYAADFNELKRLGGDGSPTSPSARTATETEIAHFWWESSPLMWNQIARTVSASAGLDLWENARLFGLLNMALADGYIGNWDAKHFYNRWRPETAVRLGDFDGNPRTAGNPFWKPLIPTGATPEYDSGHSIEGGAAARVLARLLGTDRVTFTVCSFTMPAGNSCNEPTPTLRTFTSFSQAAAENGRSRILVGWHFRNAVERGIAHGHKIANRAVSRFMRPVHGHRAAAPTATSR